MGKMCEPRLKSHLVEGRDREAGWDWRMGTSKIVRVAIPPAAMRAVDMEIVWRKGVNVDIVAGSDIIQPRCIFDLVSACNTALVLSIMLVGAFA